MQKVKKDWFRDHLTDWVSKRRGGMEFSRLNAVQQSKEMTRFYVLEIIARVSPGLIPDDIDEIDDFVVDGPDDGGADFIYRSDNAVLIIQSKYRGRDKREEPEAFTHFCAVVQRLYEASQGKRTLNRKVMDAISTIDWDSDTFDLRFCTLGKVSDDFNEGTPIAAGISTPEDRIQIETFDETALNQSLRDAISTDQTLTEPITLRFLPTDDEQHWIEYSSTSGRQMFVGFVSGMDIAQLAQTKRYKLFTMNIRDYVGETSTNRGIVNTACEHPDDFVFFNNGVSAVATQIRKDSHDPSLLHCEQFSIINGAQTVRSLLKVINKKKLRESLKGTRVLFRVMQFRFAKDGPFISDVTKYNNTQNAIKISDFRSNDPVQLHLRKQFAQISVQARTCDYKNKRLTERDSNKFPIGMEEFAKTVYSFRYGPDDMEGGTRFLFDTSAKGGYTKVFGDPNMQLTNVEFELAAGIYFLCYEIQRLWKLGKEAVTNSAALERRWLLYFAAGELLRLGYSDSLATLEHDLRHLANPNKWMNTSQNSIAKAIKEIVDLASTAMKRVYKAASAKQDFRHRNWFRTTQTLADIRNELDGIKEYRSGAFPTLRP
jgi:hypothetical protein